MNFFLSFSFLFFWIIEETRLVLKLFLVTEQFDSWQCNLQIWIDDCNFPNNCYLFYIFNLFIVVVVAVANDSKVYFYGTFMYVIVQLMTTLWFKYFELQTVTQEKKTEKKLLSKLRSMPMSDTFFRGKIVSISLCKI